MILSVFGSAVPGATGAWLDAGFASGLTFALPLGDVIATVAAAVLVSTLAALYPAARAAKNSAASSNRSNGWVSAT